MGECYSVEIGIRSRDAAATARAMGEWMRGQQTRVDFALPKWAECGVGTEKLDDLVRIMLAGWPSTSFEKDERSNGETRYRNDFNASYGWEGVMIGLFEAMGPTLEDGCRLYIEAGNARTIYEVRGGVVR